MSGSDPHGHSGPAELIAEILKPRMRGWLHTYAAITSVATGATLVAVAAAVRGTAAGWSTTIYAVTVTALFSTSALYHRMSWGRQAHGVMKRLDHSMIFVFIAGSYTPFAVLALSRRSGIALLVAIWTGAIFGVLLKTGWPDTPRALSVLLYIALGWAAIFVLPQLLHRFGLVTLILVAAGGLFYTLGALVYALKRPEPFPGTFGFHEVFHLCTLVAAICHYVAVWLVVFA